MDDRTIINQIQKGDHKSLELLIDKYNRYVTVIVFNILNGVMGNEDIQEVVSDTFFLLWKNIHKVDLDTLSDLKNYLATIAKNAAKSKLRAYKQTLPLMDEILNTDENEIEKIHTKDWVISCIRQLKRSEQIVLIKYYYQCKTIKEISDEELLPESTVKTRLRTGKIHLKELLEKGE